MVLRHPRPKLVLSLTPLIDVVFILLIFFMLVSQFTDWRKIELMPQVGLAQEADEEKTSSLHVMNDGTFRLNGETIGDLPTIVEQLASAARDDAIFLSPEDAVEIQRVVDVIEALRKAGLANLQLVETLGDATP